MFGGASMSEWHAVWTENAKVSNERLKAAPVSGRADDRVGFHSASIGEHDFGAFELLHLGDDPRPALFQRSDEAVIDRGIAQMPMKVGVHALTAPWQAEGSEISEQQPLDDGEVEIGNARRQMVSCEYEQRLSRKAEDIAFGEVRRSAHRQADRGASRDQVPGDVDTRIARPDDEDLTVPVSPRASNLG